MGWYMKDGGMVGWWDGRMVGWKNGGMIGWSDGRMDGWWDGRMVHQGFSLIFFFTRRPD